VSHLCATENSARKTVLWGGGEGIHGRYVNRWSPHSERPEPISYRPETGQRLDRGDRDGFVERLVARIVPGVERQPLKKLAVDESALLKVLNCWRRERRKRDAQFPQSRMRMPIDPRITAPSVF
jgi:hypothetical protein